MSISDRLDQIQARAQAATPAYAETSLSMDGFDMHEDYPEYGQGQLMNAYMLGYGDGCEDKPAMLAAIRAVLDLHKPRNGHDDCGHCVDPADAHWGIPWPCPTVRAIEAALGED